MTRWKTDSEDTRVANIDLLAGKALRRKVCPSFSGGQVVSRMGSTGYDDVTSSISDCTSTSGSPTTTPVGKTNGTLHNGKENEYDFDLSELGNEAESYVPALRRASRPSTTTFTGHRATSSSVSTSSDVERPSNSGISSRPSYIATDFLKHSDSSNSVNGGGVASSVSDNERPSSSGISNGAKIPPNTVRKIRTTPSASAGSVYGGDATYMSNIKAPVSAAPFPNSFESTSRRLVLSQDSERPQGDVGISNIGNTCFLSSGMQCLIHSPTLAEFFLKLDLSGLNLSSSLVTEFQVLMQHAWWGIANNIFPTAFRSKLGGCNDQFNNTGQQDCQEFLAVTLDRLHEQLKALPATHIKIVNGLHPHCGDSTRNGYKRNGTPEAKKDTKRLKLESTSSGGGADAGQDENQDTLELATKRVEDYWNDYVEKNNTVVSNTFQGLFKSSVVCSECSNVSVTYEPFMYLSIPIPHTPSQNISVTFISLKDRRPLKANVSLLPDETVERLKELVTREIPGLPADPTSLQNYVVVEVVNNNVARKLDEDVQMKCVNYANRNIYMYELNENFCDKYGRHTNLGTLSGMFNNNHAIPIVTRAYNAVAHNYEDENWDKTPSPPPTQEPPNFVLNGTPDTTTSPVPSPPISSDPLASTSTSGEGRVDTTVTEEGGEGMDIGVTVEQEPTEAPSNVDSQKFECVICFDEFSYSDATNNTVLKHKECGAILCDGCIQRAVDFNTKERHEQDRPPQGGTSKSLKCPLCNVEVRDSVFVNFTSDEYNAESNLVAVLLRLPLDSNNNTSKNSGRLFGAPLVVRIPASVAAEELYSFVEEINPFPEMDSRLVRVKCDGNACSFCCENGCDGCVVGTEGFLSIPPGTALAISYDSEISQEQMGSVEPSDMASFSPGAMTFAPTAPPEPEPVVDIHDSLRSFSAVEHLDENNSWHCDQCQKPQRATKTITICRFPDCLIIQLKRFVFNSNTSYKLSTKVRFPLTDLDMSPYIAPEGAEGSKNIYDLYSCVCHHGTKYSLSSGHYTAYSKNPMSNSWSYFNDEVVSPNRAPHESEYETAYVLFFQRKGLRYDIPKRTEETIIRVAPSSIVNRPTPVASTTAIALPNGTTGPLTRPGTDEQSWDGPKRVYPEPSYATTLDGTTDGTEMNFSGGKARLTTFPCVSSSNTGSGPMGGDEIGGGFMTDDHDVAFEEDNFMNQPMGPEATLYSGTDEMPSSQSEYGDDDVSTSTQNTQWGVMD